MALTPIPTQTMPKDTTPASGRTVKYRVLARTFINGALVDPQTPEGADNFVMATAGLHGGALEQVDPPLTTKAPEPRKT